MTTEEEVIALVARMSGRPVSSITPEKTFYQLGIDGDDAVELIAELCKRYQVPEEGIDLRRYIGPEGTGLLAHILVVMREGKHQQETKELRIGDLIKTAQEHRWFDAAV